MNNKVNFLRGTAAEYESSIKDNDTFYYTTDDEKLYLGNKEITGGGVTVDDTLSDTSEHPVQNKVVKAALDKKANLSDIPTTLPANGGNADTVDGKHADDFSQIIHFEAPSDTKTAIGIVGQTTTYWCANWTDYPAEANDGQGMIIAAHYNGDGTVGVNEMWVRQLYISPHPNTKIYQRILANTDVGEWTNIADGGNAATLDGKHASDFAPYHSYAPIYTGDILDIPEMGTYSCSVSDCTNLPPEIVSWCYVTAFEFRDAGYKRFICVALNDVSSYPNVIWLASESNKTSDGKLIWSKANDGGNADTVDGLHGYAHGTLDAGGNSHGTGLPFYCKHNLFGDNRFGFYVDGYETRTHYATNADYATNSNFAANLAGSASNICLRNLSSGSADVTDSNCPSGAWYGKYE